MRYQNINAQTTVKKALFEICGWCYIYTKNRSFDLTIDGKQYDVDEGYSSLSRIT